MCVCSCESKSERMGENILLFNLLELYIYIYILSSRDRLFRSIRTLQCGLTRRTLEAGIETHPTLR